jgi:hypothetical protein
MSTDSVDDLHHAEDNLGSFAAVLEELLAVDEDQLEPVLVMARLRVADWHNYCRPTCGAEGNAGPGDGDCEDDDCCGCPCHDRFEAQS